MSNVFIYNVLGNLITLACPSLSFDHYYLYV